MSMPLILTTRANIYNSLGEWPEAVPRGYNGHVDFPHALRERRTRRYLSQLDLALQAATAQRHLSFIVSPPRGSPRPSRQAPGNMQSVLMRPSSSRMRTSRPPLTASPLSVDTVSQVNLTTLRRRTASSRGRKVYCPGAMNRS